MGRFESLDILRAELSKNTSFNTGRWATTEEVDAILSLAEISKTEIFIECGTANGWTALNFASIAPVFTFDVQVRETCYQTENITRIIGKFDANVMKIKDKVMGKKKLFFIDGDHKGGAPTKDFEACIPLLETKDTIVFHDSYSYPSVKRAIARVEGMYPWWSKLEVKTYNGMVFFGVKNNPLKVCCEI